MRHLQLYTAIRVIVREGSFRKASELLTISPSALTRQIKALEEEIGDEIFDRQPGGVRLSTIGEIYYGCFSEHLDQIRAASETVSDLRGLRIGHVRIAVSAELAHGFLQSAVNHFRNRHPNVSFETIPSGSDEFSLHLISGQADLAVILQPQYRTGVTTLTSAAAQIVGIVPEGLGIDGSLRNENFLEHDVILPPVGNGLREWLDVQFKAQRMTLRAGQVSDIQVIPNVATGRPSLQFWPKLDLTMPAPLGAKMVELAHFPTAQVVMCQQEGRTLPIAAARFAAHLTERLQD
ncbi:MAG: LysR family transcriptional regulator [Pseudoruegeria sp.]